MKFWTSTTSEEPKVSVIYQIVHWEHLHIYIYIYIWCEVFSVTLGDVAPSTPSLAGWQFNSDGFPFRWDALSLYIYIFIYTPTLCNNVVILYSFLPDRPIPIRLFVEATCRRKRSLGHFMDSCYNGSQSWAAMSFFISPFIRLLESCTFLFICNFII